MTGSRVSASIAGNACGQVQTLHILPSWGAICLTMLAPGAGPLPWDSETGDSLWGRGAWTVVDTPVVSLLFKRDALVRLPGRRHGGVALLNSLLSVLPGVELP